VRREQVALRFGELRFGEWKEVLHSVVISDSTAVGLALFSLVF
jgi:hypothetical protein